MIEQMRAEEQAQRLAVRQNTISSSSSRQETTGQEEGYWAYMQRQIQERTENLGLAGDSMDKLEDNSQGWADDVNKFVKDQKKAALKGCTCLWRSPHRHLFAQLLSQADSDIVQLFQANSAFEEICSSCDICVAMQAVVRVILA